MNQNRPDDERTTRIVTLDFNGGSHVYRNPELGMNIPVRIAPSGISADRARMLAEALNRDCADSHVRFELGASSTESKSSVRIGRTSDFDKYGAFLGLSEGIGEGDAFVLLDDSANDAELVDVIRHEAGHILGTLDHGGAGLARYAWRYEETDYFAALYSYEKPSDYHRYLKRKTTTAVTYKYDPVPSGLDDVTLQYHTNGTIIENEYSSYGKVYNEDTQTYVFPSTPPTDYVNDTAVREAYRDGSGLSVVNLKVYGGSASGCKVSGDMYVGESSDYDYVYIRDDWWNLDGGYSSTQSNYVYHRGSATGCEVGHLSVGGYGTARQCLATSLSVSGSNSITSIRSGTGIDPVQYTYELHNGLADNCIVNGGTLSVNVGGIAKDIVVRSGEVDIGMDSFYRLNYTEAEKQKLLQDYGYAQATNLIVENGSVEVHVGGELHNAKINGRLTVTEEGAKVTGSITCTSVFINTSLSGNITIKLDLRDYAVANYTDTIRNDRGDIVKQIEYFANYTTRTTKYTYTYAPDPNYPNSLVISSTNKTVSYGTFDNKDGRFYDIDNWKYTFAVNIGSVYDARALSSITVDIGGTEKGFDGGTISMLNHNYEDIPFQFSSNKKKWEISQDTMGYTPYAEAVWGEPYPSITVYNYNPTLHGETADVLWLENGWDDETEYVIDLPSEVMGSASEILSISSEDGGGLGNAVLKNSELTVSGANGGNITISAKDSDKQDHECDLELLVVPEEIPVVGKLGAKKYSEMLKKMQKDRITQLNDVLPYNIHTKFFGMAFDLTNMGIFLTVNWTEPSMTLKLQGKMEWAIGKGTAGTGKQLKLVVDLSGDNYISVTCDKGKNYSWDIVGELKVPDFKIGKFEFSNMSLKIDKGNSAFSVSAYVQLPWIKYSFGGSIGIVDGYLDSMSIGVDGLNVPLGSSGLFLQKIEGGISGIATELNLTFEGTLGLTAGPKFSVEFVDWLGIDNGVYSLCEMTLTGSISTAGDLEGSSSCVILGGLATGSGSAGIKGGELFVTGNYTFLNGCISIEGELHAGAGGITITGTGTATVPREKIFGPLAGFAMSANVSAVVTHSASDSYVMAWQKINIFGNDYTIGFRSNFEGKVTLLGATDLLKEEDRANLRSLKSVSTKKGISVAEPLRGETTPSASKQYAVTESGLTFFQVSFSVSASSPYATITFDGVEYTQEAINAGLYENMQIVNELTSANGVTIAVNNASLGEWTLNAYGDADATFGVYTFADAVTKPVVGVVEVGGEKRSATIRYTLGDLSALENATVSIFRADSASTEYTGKKIAEFAAAEATGIFEYVMTDDMPGGSYSFYLMVKGDNLAPSYSDKSAACEFITLDTEAPDQIQSVSSEWKSTGTVVTWEAPWDDQGVTGYKIRYTTGDEDMAEFDLKANTFTFDKVPNGTYDFQVAAYDAAGNLSAWSEQQSCLVVTVANAKYKDVTLTEGLKLGEYESAVNITAGDFAVTTAANSLISGSVLADATIRGVVEDTAVNGNAELIAGAQGYGITVNGELTVGVSSGMVESDDPFAEATNEAASIASDVVVDGVTVASGGKLIVGSYGKASNISVAAGGTAVLQDNAEFSGLTVDYGAILTVTGNSKYLLTDDILIAGTLNAGCTIAGNGHKIRFEQYKQTVEYDDEYWGDGSIMDRVALTNDLDRFTGKTLEIEIDSNVYGFFKITDKAQYFNGTVTVIDHTDASSAAVGFDSYSLVGNALCTLTTLSNSLYLKTVRSEIDPPTLTVEQAESNAYDTILLNATPAENAGSVKKYNYRYSLNADMSDAVTIDSVDYTGGSGGISISKYDLVDNATYYVQASVENDNGVQSLWSDAVSFTVVSKLLPDAPTSLTVTGATNNDSNTITFTATGVDDSNFTVREYRFRYADNPEMKNAIVITTGQRLINYASIDKSNIEDGRDYYVQAGVKQAADWSYWSAPVVFNTQGYDYDGITIGTGGQYTELLLNGKRARNLTVTEDGSVYGDGAVEVNGITVNGGFFRASGPVSNVVVNSGDFWLYENCSVSDLLVNGGKVRLMYGSLNGATIGVNGTMDLSSSFTPTITGTILIQGSMTVYNYHPGLSTDASFVFDVGAHEAEAMRNKMFIDFTSPLLGSRTFTVKLDDTPEIGDYKLAYVPNSGEFYTRLAANDGTELGVLGHGGEAIQRNGLYYALAELDSAVYLHVSETNGPLLIGKVKLSKDGTVRDSSNVYSYLTVSAASEYDHVLVEDGGQLQTVTVGDGGSADVYGELWGATIEKGGKLTMNSGCVLADRPVNIQKGGEIVVNGGKIEAGAKFTVGGTMTLNGALQSYEDDGDSWYPTYHEFIFSLDQYTAPNNAVLISDYELVRTCNASFSVSVSANQADGVYKLMGNAASYNFNITVYYEGGPSYGSYLYIGGNGSEINGKRYLLAVKDDILTLTIGSNSSGGDPEPPNPDEPDGNDNPVLPDGTLNPDAFLPINPLSADSSTDIIMDAAGSDSSGHSNSVGGEDKVDYAQITLEKAAKLSFTVDADSKVKLTFYELTEKGGGTYKKKALKSVTVSSKNGGKKTTASVLVKGGSDKLYYVAVENKNKNSASAYYNVSLTTEGKNACEFFSDGDNGENNFLWNKTDKWNEKVHGEDVDALVIDSDDIGKAIQIDTDTETAVEHEGFTNFVGFGDAMDFRKIELKSAAKLSFDLAKTTGGAAKLIVYTVNDSGKMVVASSKLTVTTKASATSGVLPNQVVLQKNVYYIAVQSTDASKGKEAYYNVSLNAKSVFYEHGDSSLNDFISKTKKVDEAVREDENAVTLHNGDKLRLDGVLAGDEKINETKNGTEYLNFVGTGDTSDIVRINANDGMKLSLKVTATDAVSLVVYGLQKNGTLKALKTVKSKNNVAELNDFELKAKSAPGGQFFLGVTSTNAKKGSKAYYNVDVVSVSGQDLAPLSASEGASLAMPESSSAASSLSMPEADSLGISDALSFGGYDTDVLADASASSLAELDDKAGWMNLLA